MKNIIEKLWRKLDLFLYSFSHNKNSHEYYLYQQGITQAEFNKRQNDLWDRWIAQCAEINKRYEKPAVEQPVVAIPIKQAAVRKPVPVKEKKKPAYRQCPRKDLPQPSAAEWQIINQLSLYNVEWYREVEFEDNKSSDYGYYRYDFYLPTLGLVIEYDGVSSHATEKRKTADAAKNRFCNTAGLRMIRYDRTHFYRMPAVIEKLMMEYKIERL
jgi:very-short-patch-repair endonuclease